MVAQQPTLSTGDWKRYYRDGLRCLVLFLVIAAAWFGLFSAVAAPTAVSESCSFVGPSRAFIVLDSLFVSGSAVTLWILLRRRDERLEQALSAYYGVPVRRLAQVAAALMTCAAVPVTLGGLGVYARFCESSLEFRGFMDFTRTSYGYEEVSAVLLRQYDKKGRPAPYQVIVCFRDGTRWRSLWDGLHDPDSDWPRLAAFIADKAGVPRVMVVRGSDGEC